MKILHIGISEHLGGIETYLYKTACNIDLSKYQFDFLTYPGATPCFYEELCALGCHFQRVTPRKESILKFCKDFDALLKREKYDIVHCHLNSLSFTEPIRLALKNNIKVIAHSHNGAMAGRLVSRLLHQWHYHTLPQGKIKKLAVSDIAGKWMFGEDAKFTVLNNGVDLNKVYYTEVGRKRIREEFCLGNKRVVVHVGAFRPQKNHEFLIDVFHALHAMEPDTMLLLVGSGDLQAQAQNKVAQLGLTDKVIFVGTRSDISDILSTGDIFLFPSLFEGFPCALIEAEATGLCCVVADTVTQEVNVAGLCEYVSLQCCSREWAEIIHEKRPATDRSACAEKIKQAKLDAESDILRLCAIYDKLVKGGR